MENYNFNLDDLLDTLYIYAKDATLEEYHEKISIDVQENNFVENGKEKNNITVDINIAWWEIYIELPIEIKTNEILYDEYLNAIKYLLDNHSRDLNLEYIENPSKWEVWNSIEEIKLDI